MAKSEVQDARKDINYTAVKNEIIDELHIKELGPAPTIGVRHMQCFWFFLMMFFGYGVRVILSVTIVAMTNPLASTNPNVPTYPHWTQKGAILSAFFWGYICPQIFSGYAANKFGGKRILITTMGIQSVLTILTPLTAAQFGPMGLMAVRGIQGFCQGFFIPVLTHLLSHWTPHEERSRLPTFTFLSIPLGTVVAILLAGIISATSYGWPMVFYLYGSAGLLWCIAFIFFGHNSPADHPSINKAEKFYIENSLGHTEKKPSHKVPWKALLTSVPVWALLAAQSGWVFGFWVLLTQIPSYMSSVMNFSIKNNSVLSSLPYLTFFALGLGLGFVSDYFINKGLLKRTSSRKLFNVLGSLLPSIALICLAYTKSHEPNKAVLWLILAVGCSAAGNVGWGVNHLDLTPNHAGTLMGLCNGGSNILAIIAPLMVQFLVRDEKDPEQWKIVFFITAAFYIVTGIIFVIFGSAKTQPWNEEKYNKNDEKNSKN